MNAHGEITFELPIEKCAGAGGQLPRSFPNPKLEFHSPELRRARLSAMIDL
jgi:hypothetical protein